MSAKVASVAVALAVGALGYGLGRVHSKGNVVHADATPKWTKVTAPLKIKRDEDLGYVSTQGFWELTDASKDTLVPVAVRIECTEYNNTCGMVEASVSQDGELEPDFFNYYVATWTKDGIVASDFDEGPCGLGHHLWLDLKDNKVTNTDYPKAGKQLQNCPATTTHSYELRGGAIVLRPAAGWE
jgi:hypothetical protein